MKYIIFLLSLVAFSANTAGTYLVQGAIITSIANTSSNQDSFTIWIEGGEGVCSNNINFPRSATSSNEIHKRAYATALAAFTTGAKIWVHNYQGTDCNNAAYIRLLK